MLHPEKKPEILNPYGKDTDFVFNITVGEDMYALRRENTALYYDSTHFLMSHIYHVPGEEEDDQIAIYDEPNYWNVLAELGYPIADMYDEKRIARIGEEILEYCDYAESQNLDFETIADIELLKHEFDTYSE